MSEEFDIGDDVVAAKALRNDGTYPDPEVAIGDVLVAEGTAGRVWSVGLYLQEHVVYAVGFTNGRVVGCLGRELVHASATDVGRAAHATHAEVTRP
jgi:nitrogen fixation protein NifZ